MRRLLAFVGLFWGLLVARVGYWLARRKLDRTTRRIERLLAGRPPRPRTLTLDTLPTDEQLRRMAADMLTVEAEPGDEAYLAITSPTLYDQMLIDVLESGIRDARRHPLRAQLALEKASAQLDAHESCDPDCGDCPELGCSHHTEIVLR